MECGFVDGVRGHIARFRYWDTAGEFPLSMIDPLTNLPIVGETCRNGGSGKGLELVERMARAVGATLEFGSWARMGNAGEP